MSEIGFFAKVNSRKNEKRSVKIYSRKLVLVKINSLNVDDVDFK